MSVHFRCIDNPLHLELCSPYRTVSCRPYVLPYETTLQRWVCHQTEDHHGEGSQQPNANEGPGPKQLAVTLGLIERPRDRRKRRLPPPLDQDYRKRDRSKDAQHDASAEWVAAKVPC